MMHAHEKHAWTVSDVQAAVQIGRREGGNFMYGQVEMGERPHYKTIQTEKYDPDYYNFLTFTE